MLTSGGVMANLMALARRARGPPARGSSDWTTHRAGGPRRRSRLRERPDAFLGRREASTCSGSRPTRCTSSPRTTRFRLRRRAGRRAAIERTGRGADAARDQRGRGLDEHRLGRRRRAASRRSRDARGCGSTSTRPTAAPRACRRATPTACPGLELADSVTIDPHKWFFQAYDIGALLVRRREDLLDDVPPGAGVLRVEPARGRAAQLVRVLDRGHPPVPRPQALDELAAPRHRRTRRSRRAQRRPGRIPGVATQRRPETSSSRASPSCRSSASGICPPSIAAGLPAEIDRIPGGLAARLEVDGAGVGQRHDAPRRDVPARRRSSTITRTATEVDGLLAALRRLSEGVVEDLDRRLNRRPADRTLATSNRIDAGATRCC